MGLGEEEEEEEAAVSLGFLVNKERGGTTGRRIVSGFDLGNGGTTDTELFVLLLRKK